MNCEFRPSPYFAAEAKRLSKRYKSFKTDLQNFLDEVAKNPLQGTDLGGGLRKIRMKISDKGKGKSAGARVITLNIVINAEQNLIALVMIYDKSNTANVKTQILKQIVKEMGL